MIKLLYAFDVIYKAKYTNMKEISLLISQVVIPKEKKRKER